MTTETISGAWVRNSINLGVIMHTPCWQMVKFLLWEEAGVVEEAIEMVKSGMLKRIRGERSPICLQQDCTQPILADDTDRITIIGSSWLQMEK